MNKSSRNVVAVRGLQFAGVSALITGLLLASVSCSSQPSSVSTPPALQKPAATSPGSSSIPEAFSITYIAPPCAEQPNVSGRLEQLITLESNFNGPSSTPKTLEEIGKASDNLVFVFGKERTSQSQGIHLGGGYVLTVAHGLITKTGTSLQTTGAEVGYADAVSKSVSGKLVTVELEGGGNVQIGLIPVYNFSIHTRQDLALVYAPTQYKVVIPKFRLSNTLEVGEHVYMVSFDPNASNASGSSVISGTVTSLTGGSNYASQFLTSIKPNAGQSGAPVFDSYGNLVGLLSNAALSEGKHNLVENYTGSNISSIDIFGDLVKPEKKVLASCQK